METPSLKDIIIKMKQESLEREIRDQAILNKIVKCGTDRETAKRIKKYVIDKYYTG